MDKFIIKFNLLLVVLGLVLSSGIGLAYSDGRDCDGAIVKDSAIIDSLLSSRLDTAKETTLLRFSIVLQQPGWNGIPDSCNQEGVHCQGPFDTVSAKFWKIWTPRVLSDYALYNGADTSSRRVSDGSSITMNIGGIWATKATILAIRKECYVALLTAGQGDSVPWVGISSKGRAVRGAQLNKRGTLFNALGKRVPRASEKNHIYSVSPISQ